MCMLYGIVLLYWLLALVLQCAYVVTKNHCVIYILFRLTMKMAGDVIDPTINPPDLKPALLPSVHLGLTITYTTLYSLLFLAVYLQLWMIYYYKHRRFSYQTVFLFLCLMWSGLRTTLFAFYFKDAEEANVLPTFFYWLLYCFPVCLQFLTLCLMVNFFGQVGLKTCNLCYFAL